MARWFLGPPAWKDLEAVLSDRPVSVLPPLTVIGESDTAPVPQPPTHDIPYAELHAHSHFSFLDGVSSPDDMVAEASRLGVRALALIDHDGLPGAVRFAQAAREHGMLTIFGAELTLGIQPGHEHATAPMLSAARTGCPDPEGEHLLVLARDEQGYRQLSTVIAHALLETGRQATPRYRLSVLSEIAQQGHWQILTGCRKGAVSTAARAYLDRGDSDGAAHAAADQIERLVQLFGRGNVAVELIVGDGPAGDALHDALVQGARLVREAHGLDAISLPVVATTNAHYAQPADRRMADVHSALRAGVPLEAADPYLSMRSAHLRSGQEMHQILPRYPDAIAAADRIGQDCAVDLRLLAPNLPPFPIPHGHTEASWLRELVEQEARQRYGPRTNERIPGAWQQIDRELAVITDLDFPGYFLIVHDIVAFCRRNQILCQGRGSAANSAVCYALGITAVEPVSHHLLFERFLAPERDGPPDIDVDIASDRREEVIQYVYSRYGRENAAQVANVITYRSKLAVRDAARALGYDPGAQDAFSRQIERSFTSLEEAQLPEHVRQIARKLRDAPRHLGIHSGGMVLCDRPVIDVCPVQWARMEGRTVLQWDKDDCADAGLVKFDLLGLGMLTAIDHALRLVATHHGQHFELATLPQEDPAVYDMLCAGDSVGVFQVESRAQIATLPRLQPRCFYDLVVEVALIRPGPIQGGSVHPYIRRRCGEEEVTFIHPRLKKSLGRTLGVPLFQEQLMQMAVDVADFTPAQADQLRRAMGAKRSTQKMLDLSDALFTGMARHGIVGEDAQAIHRKLLAFANYGFPESHAYSFAYLVYASAYLKCHYPAAFTAALLRSQPMGFYSPQSLIGDARRHGVRTLRPDVLRSTARTDLECTAEHRAYQVPSDAEVAAGKSRTQIQGERATEGPAIRLGLDQVRTISTEVATAIVTEREANGPFASIPDLARRVDLSASQLEALATAGAFDALAGSRRQALWAAAAAAQESPQRLPGLSVGSRAPMLPGMSDAELQSADAWATGITPDEHPLALLRPTLDSQGILSISACRKVEDGARVRVSGVITHRQRPATASGITFLSLEDETGILNVVCSQGMWRRYRAVLRASTAITVRGIIENSTGAVNLVADDAVTFEVIKAGKSRDFH